MRHANKACRDCWQAYATSIEAKQRAALVSWNKYESRIDEEMANLRRAYNKTRKAFLDATEERGWLADQCNVLHSHMNASPPLGMTGWLEAAVFARENRAGSGNSEKYPNDDIGPDMPAPQGAGCDVGRSAAK